MHVFTYFFFFLNLQVSADEAFVSYLASFGAKVHDPGVGGVPDAKNAVAYVSLSKTVFFPVDWPHLIRFCRMTIIEVRASDFKQPPGARPSTRPALSALPKQNHFISEKSFLVPQAIE